MSHIVLGILVGAGLQKQTHAVSVATPRGTEQCRVPTLSSAPQIHSQYKIQVNYTVARVLCEAHVTKRIHAPRMKHKAHVDAFTAHGNSEQ